MDRRPAALVSLYALSGVAGLAWQVLEVRAFVPVFGASAEAIAAVTATFLGGLGLGGALASRLLRGRRPLRLYAALEAFAGLWGAALPWALAAAAPVLVTLLRATGEGPLATLTRVALAALLVGPQAVALGATFPAVTAALDADAHPHRVGLAYGVNAVGAAIGALCAGLWLPWAFGLRLGSVLLGALNLAVAAGALALPGRAHAPAPARSAPIPGRIAALAVVTGFVGMGLELSWSRMAGPLLAARSGSDAVAFSVVLAAVVLGIGLGGLLARHRADGRTLALAQLVLCLLTLATLEPTRQLLLGDRHLEWVEGLLPVLPALALGATFPLLSNALVGAGIPASAGVGRLYAINTAGAVLGSLSTGFVLMPALGAQRLTVLLAGGAAAVSLALLRRPVALLPLLLVALALWRTPPVAGQRLIPPFEVVYDAIEGRETSTLVSGRPGGDDRALTSSGHRIGAANVTGPVNDHALRALGPSRLHKAPERVLLIGLGTGATAAAFLEVETVKELVVVELDSNMRILLSNFGTEGILADPRLRIVSGDGRWFVRANTEQWDVIAVDAYDPRTASATFYTADFYAEAAPRLAPGGLLFVKFNPASLTEPAPLAGFLASLFSVFPEGALVFVERGLFGLVGTLDRGAINLSDTNVAADATHSRALLEGARLHTDDRPLRVVDHPGASFTLLDPYWKALHGKRSPPWMGRR